jgi:membrane protein implicated in regulation of membrane protease activity
MSYGLEWIPGVVVVWTVVLLPIVPEFAVIAVLVLALAALVALVALAAVALASPYLLLRSVRRRLAQRRTRRIHSPSGIRSRSAAVSLAAFAKRM